MNEDRHYRNFGAIRDVNTLKFVGAAPIFDSGASLWYENPDHRISSTPTFKTKPFYEQPSKQLELVSSFDAFDFEKLIGVEQAFDAALAKSPRITDERREILCSSFAARLKDFERTVEP
ncbi:MAG: hypothetical protein FWG23_07520 [Eggerthellaceae bacterium]|nr:hypothetical protein [Eggerthellaceae bacterium]